MNPIPPICPFCNQIPEIDAQCHFSCHCDDNEFMGTLKLIDIDNIDKGYEIVWFALTKWTKINRIDIVVEYNLRRYAIVYDQESHYTHYLVGQDMITILEAKNLLLKYHKMKAFL